MFLCSRANKVPNILQELSGLDRISGYSNSLSGLAGYFVSGLAGYQGNIRCISGFSYPLSGLSYIQYPAIYKILYQFLRISDIRPAGYQVKIRDKSDIQPVSISDLSYPASFRIRYLAYLISVIRQYIKFCIRGYEYPISGLAGYQVM